MLFGPTARDMHLPQEADIDPSSPVSTRLQKWLVFSGGLALFGVGSDLLASFLTPEGPSPSAILGRGELYMVTIGMLFSAAGELLYERTRLATAGAWQVTMAILMMMFSLVSASLFALAKAGISKPDSVAWLSATFVVISALWGIVVIFLSGTKGSDEPRV